MSHDNEDTRDDRMQFTGYVKESNKGTFTVFINEKHSITCKLSGKIKMHEIKVIVGDEVIVEVSPYNLHLGRIVKRMRKDQQR